jgi:hypothetical protein
MIAPVQQILDVSKILLEVLQLFFWSQGFGHTGTRERKEAALRAAAAIVAAGCIIGLSKVGNDEAKANQQALRDAVPSACRFGKRR